MATRSLRLRIVLGSAASIAVALTVAGVSLILLFERQMLHRVEQELVQRWTELAAAFSLDDNGKPVLHRPLSDPRYTRPYGGAYWQISEGGTLALGSRSLWDKTLSSETLSGSDQAIALPGPNGGEVYAVARSVTVANRAFALVVALDHAEVIEHRRAFERDVAFVLVPIGLVLSLGAWLQLKQNLGPLRRVRRQLGEIRAGRRRRLAEDYPVELDPLVTELNLLLDRQDSLLRKARARAATLAHGLKTPLTLLASQARQLGRDGHDRHQAAIDAQIETMRRHVDRELARARTAGRSAGGSFTPLAKVVDRLLRLMKHLPRGDEIAFVSTVPADIAVRMEADDLAEVLGNLLDNARQWAVSRVTVFLDRSADGGEQLVVEDDGPGFSPDRLAFAGLPGHPHPARRESNGLGLGITGDILAEYGTGLDIRSRSGACRVSFSIETPDKGLPATSRPEAATRVGPLVL